MIFFLYIDRKLLKRIFHALCVLATVSLSIQCLYNYFLNETASIIEYQKFQKDALSGYPSISMCFMHPFLEPELRILGTNTSSYIKYLQGKFQDEQMKKIKYDDVTISLKDYVDAAALFLLDGNRFPMQLDDDNIYVSLRTDNMKCFTIDIPFIKDKLMNALQLEIRNSVFTNKKRPLTVSHDKPEGFAVTFQYPRQFLYASNSWKTSWKDRSNESHGYLMQFHVNSFTSVHKRKDSTSRCISDWRNYDHIISDLFVKKMGCHPFYWKTTVSCDICSNAELKNYTSHSFLHTVWNSQDPPCQSIEQLVTTYEEIGKYDYLTWSRSYARFLIA